MDMGARRPRLCTQTDDPAGTRSGDSVGSEGSSPRAPACPSVSSSLPPDTDLLPETIYCTTLV